MPPTLDAAGALDAAPLDDARTLDGAPGGEAGACARADVTIPDDAASQQSSGGPAGCTNDEGCAVRYEGDYCACPSTPRPITATRARACDESLNGVGLACTCPIPPCAPLPPRRAVCVEGRCALLGHALILGSATASATAPRRAALVADEPPERRPRAQS